MEIEKLEISKIDVENQNVERLDPSEFKEELMSYLKDLFQIIISEGIGRKFEFERETTEVRHQITDITNDRDFEETSEVISQRLLRCETDAQEKVAHLGVEILKGIVVQATIRQENDWRFIICKADHKDFLDEINYERIRGLPVKKKVFKAFVCGLQENNVVQEVIVYDTNPKDTKYWWDDFLELKKIHTDEYNTEKAFSSIDKTVFSKIRKKYPRDYTYLRNSTVRYFRSNERFDMQNFLEVGIGNYEPYDSNLDIDELKEKIKQLPTKKRNPFDNQFTIIKSQVKARFKNIVKLTNEIDLNIKQDVPEYIIKASKDNDGTKYVKIRSEEGYKYFKKDEEDE